MNREKEKQPKNKMHERKKATPILTTTEMNNVRDKRIMILGAGHFQLPAIIKAVELGYEVITVDYLPDNIGHRYSHRYFNCSTTDTTAVLRAAQDYHIDGICTFASDIAVGTVSYVAERLGLPGISYQQAIQLTRKSEFRQLLRRSQLPCPNFSCADDFTSLCNTVLQFRFPVICKPVDTSGSRGISRIDQPNLPKLKAAFEHAQHYSRTGNVCIEECISGIEVGGDGFLVDGRLAFVAITNKYLNAFAVSGHSLPCTLGKTERARVRKLLQDCCAAAAYTNGPINFDIMLTDQEAYILEVSPRSGGNGIPTVIEHATGFDVERATLQFSVGDRGLFEISPNLGRSAGSFVFGSPVGGRITSLRSNEQVRREVPQLLDLFYNHSVGDNIDPFIHGGNMVGYSVFRMNHPCEYSEVSDRISRALSLRVSGDQHG